MDGRRPYVDDRVRNAQARYPAPQTAASYGALRAPPAGDIESLRRQQAEFKGVTREISRQNSWMAVPALAPAAVIGGLGAASFVGRASVTAGARPLVFATREAWQRGLQPLSTKAKNALREQARIKFARAHGISAAEMGGEVHHIEPLEFAHLTPKADPNRLANLQGLPKRGHPLATSPWATYRATLNGRPPSQAELMQTKLRIQRDVDPYALRAGVSRTTKLPPKGRPK